MADNNKYHNGHVPSNGHSIDHYFNSMDQNGTNGKKNDDIDFKHLFFTLWNRKWLIVGTIFLLGVLAGIYSYTVTPVYESDGSLLIEESRSSSPLGEEALGQLLSSSYGIGTGSTIANELQVLRSRKLSNLISDSLMSDPIMRSGRMYPILFRSYPDDSTITTQDTVAMRLRKKISFERANLEAKVVNITYQSPSPLAASDVVNIAMQEYTNLSTHQKRTGANSAVAFLQNEKQRISKELAQSEEQLRKFMNKSKLVQVQPQTEQLIEHMADLESRRQEAKAKLVAANSAVEQYKSQLNNIKPGLAEQYSEAVGPNITKLQYAKSELQLQKQKLLANNPNLNDSSPQVQEIDRKIASYKNRIEALTQRLINKSDEYIGFLGGGEAGIAQSISELNKKLIEAQVQQKQFKSQVEVISSQLDKQQQFFDNLPDNVIELAKLKRDVKINESLYETVAQQYAETALWQQTQFGLGRIVDDGYVPKDPVKPKKKLYVLIGFFLGGILSIGYILTRDAFNVTIEGVEKMKKLKEPLLSVIPTMDDYIKEHHNGAEIVKLNGTKVSSGLVTILDNISPISESFRRLQNNLIYSNPDSALKSIMVTSSAKGEGKTTTIANLGIVLSEAGYKTLIVDTDFRRPNLHNMFGLKKTPGFVDALFDDIKIENAIQETISPGLSVLSAGRRPPNAAAITQSQALLDILKKVEQQYDFVLIDTPPFGIITDASAMLKQTDGVVVIARFGKTSEVQLTETLEQLHRLNAQVMGTVLTAFNHTESSDYYFSSSYYKQVYQDYNDYQEKE